MATFEIEIAGDVLERVKKIAEMRETTQKDTVAFLVGTGSGRYLAATGWAKKNKKPAKPRVKKEPKAKAAPKAKGPKVRKAAKPAKEASPSAATPAAAAPAASPAPAAAPSPLD